MKHLASFLVVAALLAGCEREEGILPDPASEYVVLRTGAYQIYNVTEVHYSVSTEPIELNYQLKTEVVDSFPSGTGFYTYVLHRTTRNGEADPWQSLDTWSIRQAHDAIIVSEGNTPYVKLKSPVALENIWDGNMFNTIGRDEYRYSVVGRLLEVNGFAFPETLTVEQENNEDPIVFRDQRKEVYAPDVGLVYKEFIQLHYCTTDACLGQQQVDEGIEQKMIITEYGRN